MKEETLSFSTHPKILRIGALQLELCRLENFFSKIIFQKKYFRDEKNPIENQDFRKIDFRFFRFFENFDFLKDFQ